MKRRSSWPGLLAVLLALPPAAASPQPAPTMEDALNAIAAYAPRAMAEQGTPGLAVAITGPTNTLRILTAGYANADTRAPVTEQTRFAIGSITKSMTALALLQLHDAGKLDLNAPVQTYLPWFSIRGGNQILVHQLLSHTAGTPDDYAAEIGYDYDIAALRGASVLFAPGTAWAYSNDGYATLGAVLAKLDRRSWMDAVAARVFGPIGMTDSADAFTPDTLEDAAVGYQYLDNDRPASLHPALVASPPMDFVDPAGSVLSTPEDMARYMRVYLNGGKTQSGRALISPETFAAMTQPDHLLDGKPAGSPSVELAEAPAFYRQYGYGLSVFEDNGDHLIGHTGGVSGYTACMQMNLTRGFGVIAFANLVEAPLHPCAIVLYAMRALRAQSLGQPLPPPPPPPDITSVSRAADYAGSYTGPNGAAMQVVADGNRIELISGGERIALYPRGDDEFWADSPRYATFLWSFGRDAAGSVVEASFGPDWYWNQRYRGPKSFSHPRSWDALTGRYENTYFGQPFVSRVIIIKGHLTLDGATRLRPLADGTFALGSSIVRFEQYAGGRPTRVAIDGTYFYRVELP